MSIANRSVYPAITSILRIYLDNTPLYTPRVLCFFIHNDSIHDSSFGDQTALDVNKNIFPCKSGYKSQANPSSVNQDSISLPFSLSLGSLNPLYGSLPRSRTVLHRLHYETSRYKENANLFATGCEAEHEPISTLFTEKLQKKEKYSPDSKVGCSTGDNGR